MINKKNKLEDFIEKYTSIVFFILSIAIFGMFIIVFMQVLFRYVLNLPLFWIEETARYLLIFIAIMGGTLAFKDDVHPRVAFFYDRLKYSKRIKWELFLRIFIMIFLIFLVFSGWNWAKTNSCIISVGIGISFFWPLMSVPIGAVAMLIILIVDSLNILLNKRSYLVKDMKTEIKDKELL
jgi:TRAP-type C4-dicarboxylate transport system permease small subunit